MVKALKLAAIVANVVLFGTAIYLMERYGFGGQADENFFIMMMALSPALNMLAMIAPSTRHKNEDRGEEDNLVTLFVKRKVLEEKSRIKSLKDREE